MSQSSQDLERRKENIASIEPLISAMRTISLSQWRMALNRQSELDAFLNELEKANNIIHANINNAYAHSEGGSEVLIILGSNRGLCGNFNKRLLRFVEGEALSGKSYYRVFLIGKQLSPLFRDIKTWDAIGLDFPDIKDVQDAAALLSLNTPELLDGKMVEVVYNAYQGASRYAAVCEQIYPLAAKEALGEQISPNKTILDTDPVSLTRMLRFLTFNTHLQTCFYSSMASEHSSRFAMMENADRNVEDLISELDILLQDYRKGKITAETQELAVASGLLKGE